jgi:hypothetical protein
LAEAARRWNAEQDAWKAAAGSAAVTSSQTLDKFGPNHLTNVVSRDAGVCAYAYALFIQIVKGNTNTTLCTYSLARAITRAQRAADPRTKPARPTRHTPVPAAPPPTSEYNGFGDMWKDTSDT